MKALTGKRTMKHEMGSEENQKKKKEKEKRKFWVDWQEKTMEPLRIHNGYPVISFYFK